MDILGFCKRQGMTQAALSKALDTSGANVNKWVNGKGFPSYEICKRLLELGMRVDELFDVDYEYVQQTVSKPISHDDFMEKFNKAMEEWAKTHKNP